MPEMNYCSYNSLVINSKRFPVGKPVYSASIQSRVKEPINKMSEFHTTERLFASLPYFLNTMITIFKID